MIKVTFILQHRKRTITDDPKTFCVKKKKKKYTRKKAWKRGKFKKKKVVDISNCQIGILEDCTLVPECSAAIEPCPHYHTCGISGWPSPPPCGPGRLYPALPSLQEHLQIYTGPRLHETWTKTHKKIRTKFQIFLQPPHQIGYRHFSILKQYRESEIANILSQNMHSVSSIN